MCLYYHINSCKKDDCNDCKFVLDYRKNVLSNYNHKTSEELIFHFQQYCRQNYNDFYSMFLFLQSIAAIDKEKSKLEGKLKSILEKWNANIKI